MSIAFVRSGVGFSTGSSTSQATAAFALTTGDHVFVWVVWETADATITIADTAGNSYTALTHTWATGGGAAGGQWFYALSATGHASNVVTATWSGSCAFKAVEALVLSGAVSAVSVQVTTETLLQTSEIAQVATVTNNPGAMLLAGYKCYGGDSNKHFYKGATPMVNVASGSIYSEAAYLARPSGDAATVGPKYTDANSSIPKILHVVTVDVSGAVATVRPQVCVCT